MEDTRQRALPKQTEEQKPGLAPRASKARRVHHHHRRSADRQTGRLSHRHSLRDESFLVVYEKWSKETDSLLGYRYHYQRPDGWFVRYDMHETELSGHPKHHLQAQALGQDVRLPTGEVSCEQVLEMIVEQFVREGR